MRRKVYVETSVISYLTARRSKNVIDAGHQLSTYSFWQARANFDLVVSEFVIKECTVGDASAAQRRLDALSGIPLLDLNAETLTLAKELVNLNIVPEKASVDALHISIATMHMVDYLLTWNCKHIANPEIQVRISAYLQKRGLFLPFICTPDELLGDEND